jgi:hypothetical protein
MITSAFANPLFPKIEDLGLRIGSNFLNCSKKFVLYYNSKLLSSLRNKLLLHSYLTLCGATENPPRSRGQVGGAVINLRSLAGKLDRIMKQQFPTGGRAFHPWSGHLC